jgi:hypothetical protein
MTKFYKTTIKTEPEHKNPVLTKKNGIEYHYRLIKKQLQIRAKLKLEYPDVEDEFLPLPYGFIVAILKHYIYHFDALQDGQNHGKKVLLLAQSEKRDFAVAILVAEEDR